MVKELPNLKIRKLKEIQHVSEYSNKRLQVYCREYPDWLQCDLVWQFKCIGMQDAAESSGVSDVYQSAIYWQSIELYYINYT